MICDCAAFVTTHIRLCEIMCNRRLPIHPKCPPSIGSFQFWVLSTPDMQDTWQNGSFFATNQNRKLVSRGLTDINHLQIPYLRFWQCSPVLSEAAADTESECISISVLGCISGGSQASTNGLGHAYHAVMRLELEHAYYAISGMPHKYSVSFEITVPTLTLLTSG